MNRQVPNGNASRLLLVMEQVPFQQVRGGDHVIIQKQEQIRSRFMSPAVAGGGGPGVVLLQHLQGQIGRRSAGTGCLAQGLGGAVAAAVAHHDYFEGLRGQALCSQRRHHLKDQLPALIGGDNH